MVSNNVLHIIDIQESLVGLFIVSKRIGRTLP